ncbi:T9SS type A sorting domain-containing protein [Pontibacter sp. JH31]|uniref:T9SS type A sorting domain-containing protein n=2 Tax=Pontibacter aquaedesilientis TaxID=2766980 RepID=A0ABR7XGB0_9BACT|nr:T9SS type A sorting domain-containing protein [Pontibacter aquaedesilientis]
MVGKNAGVISVLTMNSYGTSGIRQLQVEVTNVPAQPEAIVGPASLCGVGKATYRVQPFVGGIAYQWSLPTGWAVISGQGTGEIEVEAGAGKGTISVTTGNACGQSAQATLVITITPAIANNLIPANQTVCAGESTGMLVGSVPSGGSSVYTYLWERSTISASEGFAPAAGANNTQNYTPGLLNQTTWFRRKVTSEACEHTSEAMRIHVSAIPDKPVIEQTGSMELRASVAGEYYEWLRNGVLLQGNAQSVQIKEEGAYKVRVRNTAGCFSPYSDALEFFIKGTDEDTVKSGLTIYLNQANGKLTITTQEPLREVELQMISLRGQVVYSKYMPQIQTQLELELGHLPNGVYLLLLKSSSKQVKRKILLQH